MNKYSWPMSDLEFERIIDSAPFSKGTTREVFAVPSDGEVIVKKVLNEFVGPNIIEWVIWNAVAKTSLAGVFGKCPTISGTGKYLMMELLNDITHDDYRLVPKVPNWLNDKKPSAFGISNGGSIKVRDYAMLNLEYALDTQTFPVPFTLS